MKKTLPILIVSLLLTASWAMAQTASLAFDDGNGTPNAGTYNPTDTITFNVNYTFAGGTSTGLSYWLETESGVASALSLTGETYSTFTTPQDSEAKPWAFTGGGTGVDSGFLHAESATQTGDAGATGTAQAASTYQVATLTFSLANAPLGTWHIDTTHLSPLVSVGTVALTDAPIAQTVYTFTVAAVPEPATWSLMGLGGLGSFGLTWLRARKRS